MNDWQSHDPRAPGGDMETLDNRQHYVGNTLVYLDRNGPYKFWRNGVQVPCVCDVEGDIVCAYHAPKDLEGTPVEPRAIPDEPDPPAAGRVPFKSAEDPA